ncbi:MAG: hypothetical protein GDA46_03460 [Bdellovibrionales bacterium]|nr:hypothetical protein [Bdellovibrionales bacterium]
MKSLVALGSGQGSTIEFFCQKIKKSKKPFILKAIVTDNVKSNLFKVAENFQIPYHKLPYNKHNPQLWNQQLCQLLCSYKPSLIVLAGFLKKIGPEIIKTFPKKIINSHPSLLPEFGGKGFYGLKIHKAVLKERKRQTGISIHWVDLDYDKGKIIAQTSLPVKKEDTEKTLEKRVKQKEKNFYFEIIQKVLQKQKN